MILETRAVAPFHKNGFVVACERTREAVIIDPGDEVNELLTAVDALKVHVKHILLTHAHLDHISGVDVAKQAHSVPIHLHKDDLTLYQRAIQQGEMFGVTIRRQPPIDEFYNGTPIRFGDHEVLVHHTPGHCQGGVCLQMDRHLFVGDTLFAGSVGRSDLPGGNHDVLMRSIVDVLFPLGDDAIVHPGHGPDTTIARERASNPFVLEYLGIR